MKWWLAAIGAVALAMLVWLFGRRGLNPAKSVRLELDVLDAKTKTQKLLVNQSASMVRRNLETEHRETVAKFDDKQKKQAAELDGDPVALSAFLVRVGSRIKADM